MEGYFVNYLLQLEAESQRKTLKEKFSGNVAESTGFGDVFQLSASLPPPPTNTHTQPKCHNEKTNSCHSIAPRKMPATVINSNVEFPRD